MYKSFRVQNFRGFKDLQLDDLARVNLIAGKNNVGKTALLEALFIFTNPYNLELILRVTSIRGFKRIEIRQSIDIPIIVNSVFREFDTSRGFVVEAKANNDEDFLFKYRIASENTKDSITLFDADDSERAASSDEIARSIPIEITDITGNKLPIYWIVFQLDGSIRSTFSEARHPSFFFSSIVRESFKVLAERHTNLVNAGNEHLLLKALQIIDKRIKSIRQTFQSGEPVISADVKGFERPLPLHLMGDGMVRLLQFVLAIVNAQDGVVLIDEIENGFHYSVLPDIWRQLEQIAKIFNVQIFATTHSLEMIRAAHQAFRDTGEDDFRFYRLDQDTDTSDIVAVKYTQKTMEAAVQLDYEVRG